MSLGPDFMNLINKLWDIEQFDMWLPSDHASISYVLDRLYESDKYQDVYNRLDTLANNENANDFAMYMCDLILEQAKSDPKYEQEDIDKMEKIILIYKSEYEEGMLSTFGLVAEKYVPDWFFGLFGNYMSLEKIKREFALKKAFENAGYSKEQSELFYEKVCKQHDIIRDLYFYVKTGKMMSFEPCTAKGISAKYLCETICKTPIEAYAFLVHLRENPVEALAEYNERLGKINKQ